MWYFLRIRGPCFKGFEWAVMLEGLLFCEHSFLAGWPTRGPNVGKHNDWLFFGVLLLHCGHQIFRSGAKIKILHPLSFLGGPGVCLNLRAQG